MEGDAAEGCSALWETGGDHNVTLWDCTWAAPLQTSGQADNGFAGTGEIAEKYNVTYNQLTAVFFYAAII